MRIVSSNVADIIFLIMTFGFPYGLSLLSAIVYIISAGGEYRLRRRETITFANGGFVYSYHDDRVGLSDAIFAFNVPYENGELKTSDEYNEISLLDVYDFSVKQLLDENC